MNLDGIDFFINIKVLKFLTSDSIPKLEVAGANISRLFDFIEFFLSGLFFVEVFFAFQFFLLRFLQSLHPFLNNLINIK